MNIWKIAAVFFVTGGMVALLSGGCKTVGVELGKLTSHKASTNETSISDGSDEPIQGMNFSDRLKALPAATYRHVPIVHAGNLAEIENPHEWNWKFYYIFFGVITVTGFCMPWPEWFRRFADFIWDKPAWVLASMFKNTKKKNG
jgi:hypothetical protein